VIKRAFRKQATSSQCNFVQSKDINNYKIYLTVKHNLYSYILINQLGYMFRPYVGVIIRPTQQIENACT
jgi:hypothetical protein